MGTNRRSRITPRQELIMKLVANGLTDDKIAKALNISEQTVKNHLTDVYIRLHAKNRANAVYIMFCSAPVAPMAPPDLKKDSLLTVSETASFLSIHRNTVVRWSNAGLLRPYRLGKRRDRHFLVEELQQFLSLRRQIGQDSRAVEGRSHSGGAKPGIVSAPLSGG